jgi:hypothetical protein
LSAVALLAKATGQKPRKNAEKFLARFGSRGRWPIGGGTAARPGTTPQAMIYNEAFSRQSDASAERGYKFAKAGLEQAVAQDVSRMKTRMEQKLQSDANRLAGRFFR